MLEEKTIWLKMEKVESENIFVVLFQVLKREFEKANPQVLNVKCRVQYTVKFIQNVS